MVVIRYVLCSLYGIWRQWHKHSKEQLKMNIKISKKRAAKIMQEEIKKFLQDNEDVDPVVLREFIESYIKGEEK